MITAIRTIIIAIFFASGANASTITEQFTSYIAFGDSLTDDGKFGALFPPSLDGRFSNGPAYSEQIADIFNAAGRDTANLALGGATAGDFNPGFDTPLETFNQQVDLFAASALGGAPLLTKLLPDVQLRPPIVTGKNPLLSVFFGANDLAVGVDPVTAANAVTNGILKLATLDRTFDDFLVFDLPDLGTTPAALLTGTSAEQSAIANIFNNQLSESLDKLPALGLNIIRFDTSSVFDQIAADIANGSPLFGITDPVTPCTIRMSAALDPNPINPGSCLDLGIDPNTLLFADSVHPNAIVQSLVASQVVTAVEDSITPVSLPTSAPLLLAGFGFFGLVARRKSVRTV